jgi:hypothetical protein
LTAKSRLRAAFSVGGAESNRAAGQKCYINRHRGQQPKLVAGFGAILAIILILPAMAMNISSAPGPRQQPEPPCARGVQRNQADQRRCCKSSPPRAFMLTGVESLVGPIEQQEVLGANTDNTNK